MIIFDKIVKNNKYIKIFKFGGYYMIIKIILAILIGLLSGIANFIFGSVLNLIVQVNTSLVPVNLIFLPLIGVFIVFLYQKFGKDSNKGFKVVFNAMEENEQKIPHHHGSLMIFTTWLGHLFGASVGREGVAVQMGANIADSLQQLQVFKLKQSDRKIMIGAGMASGFAALFGTPIAGFFFALEMTKSKITNYNFVVPTIIAATIGNFVTTFFGLSHFHVTIEQSLIPPITLITTIKLVFIGFCIAKLGHLFIITLNYFKIIVPKIIPNPLKRIFIFSIFLAILLFVLNQGRYISLGTNLINDSFTNPTSILIYDFILKLFFTTFSLSIGFQGGEVTPLFSIGATFGVIIAFTLNLPATVIAACTYAMMFGASTNAYLPAFFIGLEIFGLNIFMPLLIITISTFIFRSKNSIYPIELY